MRLSSIHRRLRPPAVGVTTLSAAATFVGLSAATTSADDTDPTPSTDAWLASLHPGFADSQNTVTQLKRHCCVGRSEE
jgi:hypothetical protein